MLHSQRTSWELSDWNTSLSGKGRKRSKASDTLLPPRKYPSSSRGDAKHIKLIKKRDGRSIKAELQLQPVCQSTLCQEQGIAWAGGGEHQETRQSQFLNVGSHTLSVQGDGAYTQDPGRKKGEKIEWQEKWGTTMQGGGGAGAAAEARWIRQDSHSFRGERHLGSRAEKGPKGEAGKDLCPNLGNGLCSLEPGEDKVCAAGEKALVWLSRNSTLGSQGEEAGKPRNCKSGRTVWTK